jgi:hypothetical protein
LSVPTATPAVPTVVIERMKVSPEIGRSPVMSSHFGDASFAFSVR